MKILQTSEHPDLADSLHNIGSFYATLGQYQAALEYLEKAYSKFI